jgi:hypothetical protein
VAVGGERPHLEFIGESQRLGEGLLRGRAIGRGTGIGAFPEDSQGLGLVSPLPIAARSLERFLHNPPGIAGLATQEVHLR